MTADALTGRLVADENQLAYDVPGASSFDLLFDGRRVWSFSADKGVVDPDDPSGLRRVPWPEPIRTRLDGHARIALRDPRTKTVLVTTDVAFGTSAGRVELVDDAGRPLALHKWGKLQRPFEAMPPEDLDAYLDFVDTLMDVLRTECGVEPFMSFGALLGAVRSGRLIGHDVDIDIGYFSETRYPVDMILEGMRIERVLRTHGWRVIRDNAAFIQVFAPSVGGVARNVDIFTSWVDVDGNLYQANDITTRGSRDDVVPLSEVELEGRMVPAPRNTELFLQAAYGPSWRVPDPTFSYGFNYERRRMRGWIGGLREERARWREHFVGAGGRERGEPSDFAHTVLPRLTGRQRRRGDRPGVAVTGVTPSSSPPTACACWGSTSSRRWSVRTRAPRRRPGSPSSSTSSASGRCAACCRSPPASPAATAPGRCTRGTSSTSSPWQARRASGGSAPWCCATAHGCTWSSRCAWATDTCGPTPRSTPSR